MSPEVIRGAMFPNIVLIPSSNEKDAKEDLLYWAKLYMFLKGAGFVFRAMLEVRDPFGLSHGSVLVRGRLVGTHLLATYAGIDLGISVFSGTRKGNFFSFANRKTTCIHNKASDAPPQTKWVYCVEDGSDIVTREITSIQSKTRLGAADTLCNEASLYCRTFHCRKWCFSNTCRDW
jgi:hypothetical protein